jgi:hypothetical protein
MRVCQPGPVAFHRAKVSGGTRSEIDVRALPDFGRPRGLSIFAAVGAPKISGRTSRARRAREKVSLVQAGFSRSARSGLRLRFIPSDLAFVGPAKTDDVCTTGVRRKHEHGQPLADTAQRLESTLAVVLPRIVDDQCAVPFERCRLRKRYCVWRRSARASWQQS